MSSYRGMKIWVFGCSADVFWIERTPRAAKQARLFAKPNNNNVGFQAGEHCQQPNLRPE